MLPTTPTNHSLPPTNLRSLLPHPETPWMISPQLFNRLSPSPNAVYRKCEILQSDPEWEFIHHYFSAQKPQGKSIAKVYCIHNGAQAMQFEGSISIMEQQAQNPHFSPQWKTEDPNPLREKVIQRWNTLTGTYTPCQLPNKRSDQIVHTKIIPLWHGTKEAICESICSTGFTTFGKHAMLKGEKDVQNTDLGYFGSGIYFTTSANYAATIYSDGNLLLAWVSMREPYPVVADKAYPQKPSDMQILEGHHAYQNYNAHYIPVVSINPTNPKCGIYYPCTRAQDPVWDEIVVFNPSQALSRFWIQLQIELIKAPTMTTFNHLLEHLLELLDKEVIQQNPEVYTMLEQKSELLFNCNLQDPLTPADLEFYNHTLKLLDQTGKIRTFVQKKLVEVHTKQIPLGSPVAVHGDPLLQKKILAESDLSPLEQDILSHVTKATCQLLLPLGKDVLLINGKSMTQKEISLKAVELDPKSAYAYHNLGRTLPSGGSIQLLNGSSMTQQGLYLKAIDLTPNDTDTYHNLGCTLPSGGSIQLLNGSSMTQQGLYLKAIDLDPNNADAYNNLGTTLPSGGSIQLLNGSSMTKQGLYLKAIDLEPNNAWSYNNLGTTLPSGGSIQLLNGSSMTKQGLYLKAIDLNPNDADAYNNLGTTLRYGGSIQLLNGIKMTKKELLNKQ